MRLHPCCTLKDQMLHMLKWFIDILQRYNRKRIYVFLNRLKNEATFFLFSSQLATHLLRSTWGKLGIKLLSMLFNKACSFVS